MASGCAGMKLFLYFNQWPMSCKGRGRRGPDEVGSKGVSIRAMSGSKGASIQAMSGSKGASSRAMSGSKGVSPWNLYFTGSRGSDSTGNGVVSLLRGMCSRWFSYFKAFRGIAERGVKFFFGQFFAVLTSLIVKTSFLESSPLPLNDSSLSVSV